jgi:pyoverdine/dityrosine biosynthesis protein Dit1
MDSIPPPSSAAALFAYGEALPPPPTIPPVHSFGAPPEPRPIPQTAPPLSVRSRAEPPPDSVPPISVVARGESLFPPESVGPESAPLRWIEEAEPISSVPVSRVLPAPNLVDRRRRIRSAPREIAIELLKLVFARRRLSEPCPVGPYCEACFAPHLEKATAAIRSNRPLHFVIPAFPAKSANPRKVLGHLPDMAERIALVYLQNLCHRVQAVYRPGARITICSDGLVFSDVVQVRDEHVVEYGHELRDMLDDIGVSSLDTFNLTDEFGELPFKQMRKELVAGYAVSMDALYQRVAVDPVAREMFNGIHRFLFEDLSALEPHRSRTQLRKAAKEYAYHTVLRSDAWSRLVERRFPNALRLSIHPQPPHHPKIGTHFVATLDNWVTPWHSTAVLVEGQYVLMKRYHAERLGATLVIEGGRPSHFVASRLDLAKIQPGRHQPEPETV